MNFTFYAVIDESNGGVCSLRHNEYESAKAIFRDREEAEACVAKSPTVNLSVQKVYITNQD